MDEKVSSLFEEGTDEQKTLQKGSIDSVQAKVNAIESIADIAEETELAVHDSPEQPIISKVVAKPVAKAISKADSNKMWTFAVVGSVLILLASAVGMVFILMQG